MALIKTVFIRAVLLIALIAHVDFAIAQSGCTPENGSTITTTTCGPSGQACGENVESNYGLTGVPANKGWTQGVTVQVNIITSGYDDAQVAALDQAFNNWNGVGGVTFNVSHNSASITVGTQNTYTVQRGTYTGEPFGNTPQTPDENGNTIFGDTTLSQTPTDPTVLTKLMAHEIGHTFGLDDANDPTIDSVMVTGCLVSTNGACGTTGPATGDLNAVNCETGYTSSACDDPGNSASAQCLCGSGTSGECSGGLVCQDGVCGCTDPCDDPYCDGWTQECGTCRDDGDCAGGTVCQSGQCGCSDSCDDSSCPGYVYCDCVDDVVTCDCPSNSCASSSCPDYDDCSCNPSDCTPTCNPDGDECDPSSCNYNEALCYFECECDDLCGDIVKAPAGLLSPDVSAGTPKTKPAVVFHPMCKNEGVDLPLKKPSGNSVAAFLGTSTVIKEGALNC